MDVLTCQLKKQSLIFPIFQLLKNPISATSSIHERYGDIVSVKFFKQNLAFVRKPEFIEEIYTLEAKGLVTRDFLYDAKKPLFGDGLINSMEKIWTPQRKLMQPIFSYQSVKNWEKIILYEIETLKHKLLEKVDSNVNISSEIKNLIQRIFIQILFGKSVEEIKGGNKLFDAIETITDYLLPQMASHLIGNEKIIKIFLLKKQQKFNEAKDLFYQIVENEVDKKESSENQGVLTLLLHAKDQKTGYSMSDSLLKDEMVNLLFAGQETTINTLSWFFYLISQNQSIQNQITKEIASSKNGQKELIYTKAVLNETLRLYPPTTSLAVKAVDNISIGNYEIQQGTILIISMYATHHHPGLWSKPNEFYPEHFLGNKKRHRYAFFPFGGGMHNCIGKHLAELEMMLTITNVLKEFNFKSTKIIRESQSVTIKPNKDIILSVKKNSY